MEERTNLKERTDQEKDKTGKTDVVKRGTLIVIPISKKFPSMIFYHIFIYIRIFSRFVRD